MNKNSTLDINQVTQKELEIYQNAVNKSIKDTNANIKKWNEYKDDYLKLKKVISNLPNEIQHEAMIPFSKLAFFPGKLIHTNEFLVLLGDNWFVERSAKQSCQIIDRRVKFVNENINKLMKDKKELEQKIEMTKKNLPIKHDELNEEGMNYVEIREDYDENEENALNEITDKTSKIHIDMNKESKKKKEFSAEDEAIFEMLKQAELEEEMENAKNKENEYEDFIKSLKEYDENSEDITGKKKTGSDEENEMEEEEKDDNNDDNTNFKHLKEKFNQYKEKEIKKLQEKNENDNKIIKNERKSDDDDKTYDIQDMSQIKNPADIYRHIYNINEQAKKNKLKQESEKQINNNVKETVKSTEIQSNITSPIKDVIKDESFSIKKEKKESSYIANIKPKPPKKKSSLFKSHMVEQRKKQNNNNDNNEDDSIRPKSENINKDVIVSQTITGGVKSIVQEHNVNQNYQNTAPRKKGKVSLFKRMAESQHQLNENSSNISENKIPIMKDVIKENPNNTAMNEDDIDFYFTQREANQEYQKRKYQKSLIAKEKPLEEYDSENE